MGLRLSKKTRSTEPLEIEIKKIDVPLESTEATPIGLTNIGNTCYMNAALQCLMQTPELNSVLAEELKGRGTAGQQIMIESYRSLMMQQQKSVGVLRNMKKGLNLQKKAYAGYRQMDSSEFFLDLLNCFLDLSTEMKERIGGLFGVEVAHQVKCDECKTVRNNKDILFALSLPLTPAKVTFQVVAGETSMSNLDIHGSEAWTSDDIRKEVHRLQSSLQNVTLLLQSSRCVLRLIEKSETMQQLDLERNQLSYYDLRPEDLLIEIKAFYPSFLQKKFLGLFVIKWKKPISTLELFRSMETTLRMEFPNCIYHWIYPNLERRQSCFSSAIPNLAVQEIIEFLNREKGPVAHLEVHLNVLRPALRPKSSSLIRDLSPVEIRDALSSLKKVSHLTENEMLECDHCAVKTISSQWMDIIHTSQYLVISLQRYNALDKSKDTRTVRLHQTLDLRELGLQEDEGKTYELYAVIKHRGSYSSGHYTSAVKYHGEWFSCDDSAVRLIPLPEVDSVLEQDAYILFYSQMIRRF